MNGVRGPEGTARRDVGLGAVRADRRHAGGHAPGDRGGVQGGPGDRWLDVGCGTGELVFMAVETGADVTGPDLAPVLVETARRQAAERGLDITFEVGDVEALPYGDESFDVVTSTVGAIFAPDHEAVASELARVTPAGRAARRSPRGRRAARSTSSSRSSAPMRRRRPPGAGVAASLGRAELRRVAPRADASSSR